MIKWRTKLRNSYAEILFNLTLILEFIFFFDNFAEYLSFSWIGLQDWSVHFVKYVMMSGNVKAEATANRNALIILPLGPPGWGGLPYERGGDARRKI